MEGEIGLCIWLGAPSMHRMSGLDLTWHWQGCWGHVDLRSHYGTLGYGSWLFKLPTFAKV